MLSEIDLLLLSFLWWLSAIQKWTSMFFQITYYMKPKSSKTLPISMSIVSNWVEVEHITNTKVLKSFITYVVKYTSMWKMTIISASKSSSADTCQSNFKPVYLEICAIQEQVTDCCEWSNTVRVKKCLQLASRTSGTKSYATASKWINTTSFLS